jgi:hypothetical protein
VNVCFLDTNKKCLQNRRLPRTFTCVFNDVATIFLKIRNRTNSVAIVIFDVFSLVPLAGIEPALLAELDFESSASTSSATGAIASPGPKKPGGSEAGGL